MRALPFIERGSFFRWFSMAICIVQGKHCPGIVVMSDVSTSQMKNCAF